jgi:hypothetical protein
MTPLMAKKAIAKVQVRIPTPLASRRSSAPGPVSSSRPILCSRRCMSWAGTITRPDVYDGELTVAFPAMQRKGFCLPSPTPLRQRLLLRRFAGRASHADKHESPTSWNVWGCRRERY